MQTYLTISSEELQKQISLTTAKISAQAHLQTQWVKTMNMC